VLVRCQIDESGQWHFVCPGACWKRVSGGVIDGDGSDERHWYRYGGMWKNKHDAVSAKKPRAKNRRARLVHLSTEAGSRSDHELSSRDDPEALNNQQPTMSSSAMRPLRDDGIKYTKNDRVTYNNEIWIARKSHVSVEGGRTPEEAHALWKEQKGFVEEPD
jgi:hypothetical protein